MSNYPITEKFLMDVGNGYTPSPTAVDVVLQELEIQRMMAREGFESVVFRILAAYTVKKDK